VFGRFRLFPAQRLLLDGKVPVRMNPNTLALLTVLVEHAGEVLSEAALVDRVWPGQTAAQVRLADHVEVLNRLFRRSRPLFDAVGRPSDGYRLVLPADGAPPAAAPLVGRDEVVGIVAERLFTARFATLVLAGQIGEPEHFRGPLMGKWMGAFGRGEYPRARDFAERLMASSVASGDGLGTFVADRMLAQAKHFLGDHAAASHHAEQVLLQSGRRFPLRMTPTPIDVRCSMRIVLARIGWLQGDGVRAQGLADEALAFAQEDHAYAVCQALCLAVVPIALWQGDDDGARRHVADLLAHARRQQLPVWERWGLGLQAVLAERAGGPPAAPPPGHKPADAFATFTGRLPDAGVLQRAVAGEVGWCAPEVFRAEGEAVLSRGGEVAQAEGWFRRALALATTQAAPAWTLRATTSLGRLLRDTGRSAEADGLLAAALRRCGGGVDADRARSLQAGL